MQQCSESDNSIEADAEDVVQDVHSAFWEDTHKQTLVKSPWNLYANQYKNKPCVKLALTDSTGTLLFYHDPRHDINDPTNGRESNGG